MMIEAEKRKIDKSAVLRNVNIKAKNVTIAKDVSLENVNVEAATFIVGEGTRINGSIFLSHGSVDIGSYTQIKENTLLKAFRHVKVGDQTIVDRGVVIGGLQSEYSQFECGSRCVILHHAYINTAREVFIGDNVCVGGYGMIFTHGSWQNTFRGYPSRFGDVTIKDDVWLNWHVIVMPGVTIGKGSTVGSGSVVTNNLPDYCFAVGVPARIVKKDDYPSKISLNDKDQLARTVLHDFAGYVKNFVGIKSARLSEFGDGLILSSNVGSLLYIKRTEKLDKREMPRDTDVLSFGIPELLREKLGWIEIDSETKSRKVNRISEEFIMFVRRYGVRIKL
jgi:acetyltransferase-like isoleucine patch superfamily enzyme